MIPRVKVNYRLRHLFKAFLIGEGRTKYKGLLKKSLQLYLDEENLLMMPSGRAGLYYILKELDASRVFIPAYTCKAVAEAVLMAGKEVVCVEVENDGFNMSVSALESVLNEDSVIIATHQFGIPCEIENIIELARKRRAFVIEDAAASLGSKVNGKLTGTFGDAAFYSFDSTKLINIPMKGGFITVKDSFLFAKIQQGYHKEIQLMPFAHKLRLLAIAALIIFLENHVIYRIFHTLFFELRGRFTEDERHLKLEKNSFYLYDLANWQAYIGLTQMKKIEDLIIDRQNKYSEYIKKLTGFKTFELPPIDGDSEWACIRFPIRVKGNKLSYYKMALKKGVDFAFSFTFIPCPDTFRNAARLANSVLDIPYYSGLSVHELNGVVSALKELDTEFQNEDK
jgi:dTDP-4-amino-4,6-dideoxygalactose transaminase